MSVQAGFGEVDGRPVDPKLLANISESLKHQGPDGESSHVDGSVALLYRPFHTTAASRRESNHTSTAWGFILTWDGRLDNRDELIPNCAASLKLIPPTSPSLPPPSIAGRRTASAASSAIGLSLSGNGTTSELIFASDYMAIRHIFYYLNKHRILS